MHGAPRTILPGKTMTAVPSNFSVAVGVLLLFWHPRCSGHAPHLRQELTRTVFTFVRSTDAVKKSLQRRRPRRPAAAAKICREDLEPLSSPQIVLSHACVSRAYSTLRRTARAAICFPQHVTGTPQAYKDALVPGT